MEQFSKIGIFGHESWPQAKVPEVAHILSFYPQEVKIKLIFALQAVVSKILADFQNCLTWALNLAIGQSARSCTYTLSTLGGQNWAYFRSTSVFSDMEGVSKLPYLGTKHGHWSKCHKLHTYYLSTLRGSKLSLNFRYRSSVFWDMNRFSTLHIWAWNLALASSGRCIHTLYPTGSKLSLFSLYRKRFPRYTLIFIYCHIWAWYLAIG